MVCARVGGVGVQQDGEPQAVELEPRHDHRQQVIGEAEIEGRRDLRAARLEVPVAELDLETLGDPCPDQRRLRVAVLIEIDMGVVAFDLGVGSQFRRQALLAGPYRNRAGRRLLIGFIGARSRIGGNVWLRRDVPPDSLVELPEPRIGPCGENTLSRDEKERETWQTTTPA
jgi:hypothetical protein